MADEGLLWYGTWRKTLGEIPFLDFQGYSPGRYYWGALWYDSFGHNLLTLRLSEYSFAAIGLYLLSSLVYRATHSWRIVFFGILLFLLWIVPIHKTFSQTISICQILLLFWIIDDKDKKKVFFAGILSGLMLFWGKNYALYSLLSIFIYCLALAIRERSMATCLKNSRLFIPGYLMGLLPFLCMLLFVDGFALTFYEWIVKVVDRGHTNLTISLTSLLDFVPTSDNWTLLWSSKIAFHLCLLLFFCVSLYSIYLIICFLFKRKVDSLQLAAAITQLVSLHVFLSRADVSHLAQSSMPVLLLSLLIITQLSSKVLQLGFSVLIIQISFFTLFYKHPGIVRFVCPLQFENIIINEEPLITTKQQKKMIEAVILTVTQTVKAGESVWFAPDIPFFYPLLSLKSPTYYLFYIFPRHKEFESDLIKDLENNNVQWILLGNTKFDGREEMMFKNTHQIVYRYVQENYQPVKQIGRYVYYKKRIASPGYMVNGI
ncbi:MAG: hypothetical protein KKI15_05480 [Proteobacteria bacterium]|nr:hypothetical protein [Pseudomonadota bacterium]